MKTLFDIGDVIEFKIQGKIKEYSARQDSDCYTIDIINGVSDRRQNVRIYLGSDALENAKVIVSKGIENEIQKRLCNKQQFKQLCL